MVTREEPLAIIEKWPDPYTGELVCVLVIDNYPRTNTKSCRVPLIGGDGAILTTPRGSLAYVEIQLEARWLAIVTPWADLCYFGETPERIESAFASHALGVHSAIQSYLRDEYEKAMRVLHSRIARFVDDKATMRVLVTRKQEALQCARLMDDFDLLPDAPRRRG